MNGLKNKEQKRGWKTFEKLRVKKEGWLKRKFEIFIVSKNIFIRTKMKNSCLYEFNPVDIDNVF